MVLMLWFHIKLPKCQVFWTLGSNTRIMQIFFFYIGALGDNRLSLGATLYLHETQERLCAWENITTASVDMSGKWMNYPFKVHFKSLLLVGLQWISFILTLGKSQALWLGERSEMFSSCILQSVKLKRTVASFDSIGQWSIKSQRLAKLCCNVNGIFLCKARIPLLKHTLWEQFLLKRESYAKERL